MPDLRLAATLALEALDTLKIALRVGMPEYGAEDQDELLETAITAIRAALAESERDWSLLGATQQSLRERMAEIHRLRQALEFTAQHKSSDWPERCQQMVDTARAALMSGTDGAEQPAEQEPAPGYCKHCKQYTIEEPLPAEQEPFGYLYPTGIHPEFRFFQNKRDGVDGMPVYTAPQHAKQPLTDEEIHVCFQQRNRDKTIERRLIARAIEASHGINVPQARGETK